MSIDHTQVIYIMKSRLRKKIDFSFGRMYRDEKLNIAFLGSNFKKKYSFQKE